MVRVAQCCVLSIVRSSLRGCVHCQVVLRLYGNDFAEFVVRLF